MRTSGLIPDLLYPRIEEQPGVYAPAEDSRLLMEAFARGGPITHANVLDVCCGSGFQGIAAAMRGHHVVAIDSEQEAVQATRRNAWLNDVEVEAVRGKLFAPVRGWIFDAIVANPPYVPAAGGGERIAWCDGGPDGRSVIDPICRGASALLRDGGKLWMVHSELADVGRSLELLSIHGLEPEVVATTTHELGPITLARFDELVLAGRIAADAESEEISVIVAKKPAR